MHYNFLKFPPLWSSRVSLFNFTIIGLSSAYVKAMVSTHLWWVKNELEIQHSIFLYKCLTRKDFALAHTLARIKKIKYFLYPGFLCLSLRCEIKSPPIAIEFERFCVYLMNNNYLFYSPSYFPLIAVATIYIFRVYFLTSLFPELEGCLYSNLTQTFFLLHKIQHSWSG